MVQSICDTYVCVESYVINKELSFEIVAFDEVFDTKPLQPDSNESNVGLLELRLNLGELHRPQPAVGSSEPPEKYDDAGLVLPQLFERRRVGPIGRCREEHPVIGYVPSRHLDGKCSTINTR